MLINTLVPQPKKIYAMIIIQGNLICQSFNRFRFFIFSKDQRLYNKPQIIGFSPIPAA